MDIVGLHNVFLSDVLVAIDRNLPDSPEPELNLELILAVSGNRISGESAD